MHGRLSSGGRSWDLLRLQEVSLPRRALARSEVGIGTSSERAWDRGQLGDKHDARRLAAEHEDLDSTQLCRAGLTCTEARHSAERLSKKTCRQMLADLAEPTRKSAQLRGGAEGLGYEARVRYEQISYCPGHEHTPGPPGQDFGTYPVETLSNAQR